MDYGAKETIKCGKISQKVQCCSAALFLYCFMSGKRAANLVNSAVTI